MKIVRFIIILIILSLISGAACLFAATGEGTASISPSSVIAGSTGNSVVITYTAGTTNWVNGTFALVIPPGWSPASLNTGDAGYISVTTTTTGDLISNATTDGQTLTLTVASLSAGDQIVLVYGTGTGPGATAQLSAGTASFNIFTDPTSTNPAAISSDPLTINIISPSPTFTFTLTPTITSTQTLADTQTITQTETISVTMTFTITPTPIYTPYGEGFAYMIPTQVTGGSSENVITIIYTAGQTNWSSSPAGTLMVTIPTGWSPPSLISNAPGYYTVSVTGSILPYNAYAAFINGNWNIIIQVPGLQANTGTITITYGSMAGGGPGATAQSAAGIATFIVSSQPNGSSVIPINGSPYLNVIIPTTTQTSTASSTVTPTPTISTPQGKVFTYPDPAKIGQIMFFAYPVKDNNLSNLKYVDILIYNVNGDKVYEVVDSQPDGYTAFDTSSLARGVYIYKIIVHYADGSAVKQDYHKFAVVN